MLNEYMVMLFLRMGSTLNLRIPSRSFSQMFLGGAFTMVVSYKECAKKLQPFPSMSETHLCYYIIAIFFSSLGVSFILTIIYQCKIGARNCRFFD